jgi:hypothetical protein
MVDRIGPVDAVLNAPQYTGRWERQLRGVHQAMGSTARPLGARTGVRPGTPTTTVTATSTTWTCQAFAGEADVETAAEAGAYPFSFDAVATGAMTPADGTNARIDIIYVQIDDPSEDGSAVPAVTRKYLAGSAGTGVAPVPPVSRAFVIAQINVPKSGTGAPSVTWVAPYTAGAGGFVPFLTKAQLDLWTTAAPGQHANVFADPTGANADYTFDGVIWRPIPFAEAAGVATIAATGITTIPFPTGRFTQPPVVEVTVLTAANVAIPWLGAAPTTTGVGCRVFTTAAAQIAGTVAWKATQMLGGSAAG